MRDRNTPWRDGELSPVPVAQATEIFGGHIIGANAGGFAVMASAVATQTTLGVSDGYADNRAGANGDVDALVRRGKAWCFANFAGDAVTQADVGKDCYVADSQTVAKSNGATDERPVAGKVIIVDSDGVWVLI
ncbi:hypothetical protein ACX1HO_12365 [Yersinia enterocolitica]|uniref:hypothetical protein n=1 Tax=Yersinia enterocolitica TaxID=630 RepID=UPI00291042F1|nr:hypothetical protein [Yersinia enterocolitica]HEB2006312.1 hypothetical protein [Yersinia enterocolitica]HEI6960313.1 hypothetical protein [Yersinia enterocolitica]HEN3444040.1 hypothetical protein [Yersinia enterocolitica]HEN3464099.1 hypothetical protein [Yersinia enterocolitica]